MSFNMGDRKNDGQEEESRKQGIEQKVRDRGRAEGKTECWERERGREEERGLLRQELAMRTACSSTDPWRESRKKLGEDHTSLALLSCRFKRKDRNT